MAGGVLAHKIRYLNEEENNDEQPDDFWHKKQAYKNLTVLAIVVGIYIPVALTASSTCLSKTWRRACFLACTLLSTLVLPCMYHSPLEHHQLMQFANMGHFALNLLQAQVLYEDAFDLVIAVAILCFGFSVRIVFNVKSESMSELKDINNPETLVLIMGSTFAVLALLVLLPTRCLSQPSQTNQTSQRTQSA